MTELKKSGTTASEPPGVQSIHRALSVLELIAASDAAVGVTVIANSTGLAPATAHRLLRTLQARGYVQHVDERKYALGAAALRLGASAQRSVATGARPRLAQLVAATGETANLAVLEGDDAVYVAQSSSPHMLRMFAEVGRHVLPHSTAVGKALLSAHPNERIAALLRRTGLPRRTERTITSIDAFLADIERVRDRGYAVDDGEEDLGVRCLAVPVWDRGSIVAAVSVSGPVGRLGDGYANRLIEPVTTTAKAISQDLLK